MTSAHATVQKLLPASRVFPEYIQEMLLRQLATLTNSQVELLEKILLEEKETLANLPSV